MVPLKILYVGCHAILEYDEVKLFTELGHDVFSVDSYRDPLHPVSPLRPPIEGMVYHKDLDEIKCSREQLDDRLIEWADVIYIMHIPQWVYMNWEKMKHKVVVWRSIGQSSMTVESSLYVPRMQGLKIVRYSPQEENISGYIGKDATIRFYKDPEEFKDWNGVIEEIITVAQHMRERSPSCNYNTFEASTSGLKRTIFGPGNENLEYGGGNLTYEQLKAAYRNNRCYFYTGTYPAAYTLGFIEAFMTGIPIVSIGNTVADIDPLSKICEFEIGNFIQDGFNGYIANDIKELRIAVFTLLKDFNQAKFVSGNGRETAIKLFGKETIKKEWEEFLCHL